MPRIDRRRFLQVAGGGLALAVAGAALPLGRRLLAPGRASALAFRAVVQRRRAIGVLRALGYRRGEVVAGIVTETTLTTTVGVLVGIVTGLAAGYIYLNGTTSISPFGLDLASLAGTLALMYAAVLLTTFGPALAAAHIPPAQALRLQE